MADSTRTIRVVIDSTGAKQGAKEVNDALNSIGKGGSGMGGITDDLQKVKKVSQETADSFDKVGKSAHVNTGAMREFLVLMREFSRGDVTRIPGSLTIFASRTGALEVALTALSGVGFGTIAMFAGMTVGLAAVAVASIEAANEHKKLNNTLALTGNYAGLTTDSFRAMAQQIDATTNATTHSAQNLIMQLAGTGKFTSDQIGQLAFASQRFAEATGQDASKVLSEWTKAADAPGKFAEEFSSQYAGVISPTEALMIKDLEARGQKYQALTRLIQDLNAGMAKNTEESTNALSRSWTNFIKGISDLWTKFYHLFDDNTLQMKIDAKQSQLDQYKSEPFQTPWKKATESQLQGEITGLKAQQANQELKAEFDSARIALQRQQEDAMNTLKTKFKIDNPFDFKVDKQAIDAYLTTLKSIADSADPILHNRYLEAQYLIKNKDALYKAAQKRDEPEAYRADRKPIPSARSVLEDLGANVTSTRRDDATQRMLYLKAVAAGHPGDAAKPISMGGTGGAHERGMAIDWTTGASESQVKAALEKAGYKGVTTRQEYNGSHHAQWTNQVPASMKDAAKQQSEELNRQAEIALRLQETYTGTLVNLRDQVKYAGMMPSEAAKQQEIDKVLNAYQKEGVKLGKTETDYLKEQVNLNVDLKTQAEALAQLKMTTSDAAKQYYVDSQKQLNLNSVDAQVQDGMAQARLAALQKFDTLQQGINYLNSDEWKIEEAKLLVILKQNAALDNQRKIHDRIVAAGQNAVDGSIKGQADQNQLTHADTMDALKQFLGRGYDENGKAFGPADYASAIKEENDRYTKSLQDINDRQLQGLQGIADGFNQVFGDKVGGFMKGIADLASSMANMQSGANGNPQSGFGKIFKGLSDVSGQLGSAFGGSTGSFFQGLSKTLGQAGMGAEIGSATVPIGKAIWSKYSSTGAQIGGAIGGLTGNPLIALGAAVVGGIIGGLFKKDPHGKATAGFDVYGNFQAGTPTGKGKDNIQQAADVANAVTNTINGAVQALGGTLNSASNFQLSVDKGKRTYKVNGQSFTDEASAIAAGIKDALSAGIITGISDFSQRILKQTNGKNVDELVQIAAGYENVLDGLAALTDPVKNSIETLYTSLDKLVTGMRGAGATTAELANVEQYRQASLKKIISDEQSSLLDFKKTLSGSGSGVTDYNRLKADQADFVSMQQDIANGKTVDQQKYIQLAQEIFQLAGNVFGTSTTDFQNIRQQLIQATDGALLNIQTQADQTVAAIENQTNQLVQTQTVTNGYLANIQAILAGGGSIGGYGGGGGINGRYNLNAV